MNQSQRTGFKKAMNIRGLDRYRLLLLAGEQLSQDELLDLIYDKTVSR